MPTRFSLVIGRDAERRHVPLPDSGVLKIGRGGGNDLVLGGGLVSSRHAEIQIRDGAVSLRDVGSRNGTWVNGCRVEEEVRLSPGDRLVIGGSALTLAAEDPPTAPVTLLEDREDSQQVFASIDTSASVLPDERTRREAFRALAKAERNLAVLHEMGGLLLEAKDEADVCGRILDLVFDVTPADRACVILTGPDGSLETKAARTREKDEDGLTVSRTILGKTLRDGLSLLTSDAISDERFRGGHSVIIQGIRAAMCVPVRGKRAVLGAVYVDTRIKTAVFTPDDLEVLTTLGIQGGISIEHLRLLKENMRAERLAAVGAVVAGLGHDIRNILSALSGGAYMMDHVVKEIEHRDLRDAWEIVRESTDTITELVNDMVSYSKERKPNRGPTDPNRVARTVANRFSARAEAARATIVLETDDSLPKMNWEAPAVDRVLSNLVSNALDALDDEGGRISIRVRGEAEHVVFVVADNGCGIPPENRERIFDLLFSTKGSKGTGFGLAITKKIVGEHGGTVEVDSEPGLGTAFTIRLPRG